MKKKKPKVAIVHDWLVGGGAERVVLELNQMFPDAPIYTSYCDDEWRDKLDGKVITGYLQKWPFSKLRKFLPLLRQWWFKRLDLSDYDLIISSSGNGEAKFARVKKPSVHICYCHSPPHFLWRHYDKYLNSPGFRPKWLIRLGLKTLVGPLRKRDYKAAQAVDYFIANSKHIQSDIKKYYGRDSQIIHPPVDIERFLKADSSKRAEFITAGRLVPHKHTDIIVRACSQLSLPLKVIGRGPEMSRLDKIAGPTVEFLGYVPNEDMPGHLSKAQAFLFASFEDFGITPIEAMASGTPVIAYKAGGALDYVIDGRNGTFFDEQTAESLTKVLENFDNKKYSAANIKNSTKAYSAKNFRGDIARFIDNL